MRKIIVLVAVLAAAGFAVPADAVPCHAVATFQACNAYCSLHGATCSQLEYEGGPLGEVCQYRYHCSNGHSTGWGPCTCGGGGGCFVPGTQIDLGDGSTQSIESIEKGDTIASFDETTGSMDVGVVAELHEPIQWSYYLVINGTLKVTPSHQLRTNGSWVQAAEIRPGDRIARADGTDAEVTTIEVVVADVTVHHFASSPHETFIADGFVVHNKPPIPKEEEPENPDRD